MSASVDMLNLPSLPSVLSVSSVVKSPPVDYSAMSV
jgi:hypothetical protein